MNTFAQKGYCTPIVEESRRSETFLPTKKKEVLYPYRSTCQISSLSDTQQ